MRCRWITIGADGRAVRRSRRRHGLRAAAVLSARPTGRSWWSTGTCRRTPRSPRPTRRWTASSSERWSAIPTSSTGRSYVGRGALRFVPVARRAAGQPLLRPDRDRHQGRSRRATASRRSSRSCLREDVRRHRRLRQAARARTAGRPAGAVPRQRARHRRRCAELAQQLAGIVARATRISATSSSTGTSRRACVKVDVLQDKARQLGVTSRRHRQRR